MKPVCLPGLAAVLALGLSAPALQAQEGDTTDTQPAGEIALTVGGTAMTYVTSSSEMDTIRIGSSYVMPLDPSDTTPGAPQVLTITGFESLEGGGLFSLGLEFTADPARDATVGRVEFTSNPELPETWLNGAEGAAPVTVTIDSYVFDGRAGKVTGSFAGDLCKAADWEAAPDPKDCKPVSGRFSTEIFAGL